MHKHLCREQTEVLHKMNMNGIVARIEELCAIESPTGMTMAAADYVAGVLDALGVKNWMTRKGNVVAELGGEGAPLALCYKAVNTMDSMVGYKNERYLYFGRAAAKLDDAANYLPARMAALLLAGAAALTGQNARGALRIWRRDRRSHASPNSAQTEAVMAGALGVQLAGPASYFGKLYEKPTIGDALRPVEPGDILRANRMLYAAGTLCMALLACARAAVCLPLGL